MTDRKLLKDPTHGACAQWSGDITGHVGGNDGGCHQGNAGIRGYHKVCWSKVCHTVLV